MNGNVLMICMLVGMAVEFCAIAWTKHAKNKQVRNHLKELEKEQDND